MLAPLCELRAPAMTPDLLHFSTSQVLPSSVLFGTHATPASALEHLQRGTKWVGWVGAQGVL